MYVKGLRIFYELNRKEPNAIALALIAVIIALTPKFSYYGIASVIIGFLFHEIAHRQTARRLGCASRFVLDPMGFIITLVSSVLPIAFLAPGYVGINCWGLPLTREGILKIAGAGPLTNIIMAGIATGLLQIGIWHPFLYIFAVINSWLAIFNLFPFGPLDGAKIFRANSKIWAVMIAVAGLIYFVLLMG